jgi:hypothetical protein
MVFMPLMYLRPRAIRLPAAVACGVAPAHGLAPAMRPGFELEERFPMANELRVRRAMVSRGVRCPRTPSAFAPGATIRH